MSRYVFNSSYREVMVKGWICKKDNALIPRNYKLVYCLAETLMAAVDVKRLHHIVDMDNPNLRNARSMEQVVLVLSNYIDQ